MEQSVICYHTTNPELKNAEFRKFTWLVLSRPGHQVYMTLVHVYHHYQNTLENMS